MKAKRAIEMTIHMTILVAAIAGVLCISACPMFRQATETPWSERTPKEKAAWMMDVYNKQYDDYLEVVKKLNLTDDQKKILQTKRDILTELDPLLDAYNEFVDSGQIPTAELEGRIITKINDLLYGD